MEKKNDLALPKENLKFIAIGLVIIIAGFLLMIGGGAEGTEFNPEIYSARRITAGPIVAVIGFFFEIYAILRKPKAEKGGEDVVENDKLAEM